MIFSSLRVASALLAGALALSGCAERITRDTKLSDRELAAAGEARLEKKAYRDASDHFRALLEKYPASPLAERAQKLLAESLESDGRPEEAEEAWNDFLRLHPGSADVPYALYRKGLVVAQLAPGAGRDPSRTREALALLQRVSREHPSSPWAPKAAERAARLREELAGREADVAEHYLNRKNWSAAEVRAGRAARDYADTAVLPRLLSLLARARDGQGKKAEAEAVRKEIRERFPSYEGERKR
jgi:outer membrane protein assembly factor BamD